MLYDDDADYYGRHAQSRYEGYLQSEYLEWLLGGQEKYRKASTQKAPRHDLMTRCSTPMARTGQALDDMVYFNQGRKKFQRVRGAELVIEEEYRA